MTQIATVLEARHRVYGPFFPQAKCSKELKTVIDAHNRTRPMDADQIEALHMIAFKISRILTGDPNYVDNWVDIAGYAQLVVNRLEKT